MSAQPRTSSKKDRRRQSQKPILAAAAKVFAEAGFGGATMQLIAVMASLPKANLHHYFPTKEALCCRVVENIFRNRFQAADIFEPHGVPIEGIGVET